MTIEDYIKDHVSRETWEQIARCRPNFDTRNLAQLWPAFVDARKRWKTEIPFLLDRLPRGRQSKVFDAGAGVGATVHGLQRAYVDDVVANEIDEQFQYRMIKELIDSGEYTHPRNIAPSEHQGRRSLPRLTTYNWLDVPDMEEGRFDAVLCIGNSLTMLFDRCDQLTALRNFHRLLADEGVLIIDERNYRRFGLFETPRHEVIYCGEDVEATALSFEDAVLMKYEPDPFLARGKQMEFGVPKRDTFGLKGAVTGHLILYPFKEDEVPWLLERAGFTVGSVHGDYDLREPAEADFITYVARKRS